MRGDEQTAQGPSTFVEEPLWEGPDAFEHAPLAYQCLDEEARILRVNRAWTELLGFHADSARDRPFREFLACDRDVFRERFATLVRDGSVRDLECEAVNSHGARLTLSLDGNVVMNPGTGNRHVLCILRDITRKKFEEKAIERAKREWEHAFDAVPDLVAILDIHYRIVRLNKPMAAKLGLDVRLAVGRRCYELVHRTNSPPPYCPHHLLIQDRQEHGTEVSEPHLGGTYVVTASPILDRDGTLIGSVHVARDITERKLAEEALKKAHEELETRVRERTAELFDANTLLEAQLRTIDQLYEHIVQSGKAKAIADHTAQVAHELRQPLAIIGGFARRLARKSCGDKGNSENQEFALIVREVERLEKILGGLIDFGRHERIGLHCADPNELIEEVLQINAPRFQEKNVLLDVRLGRDIGEISLDPDRFQEVVRNLVANAIEASPPGQQIVIETGVFHLSEKAKKTGEFDTRDYFEMTIHNMGTAIPPNEMEKLFNPFFTGKSYASGLGLTLAKKIVEDHQGSISVKSDASGTLFTVWLPVT